jgi:parallel beta-helix repeat protein
MRKATTVILGIVLLFSSLVVLVPQQSSAAPTVHDPIRIDDDAEFAAIASSEDWGGDGSAAYPYMIEGYDISGHWTTDPIYIGNTTVHFVIKDCVLWEASTYEWPYVTASGITLNNVSDGLITLNDIADVNYDITLLNCDRITIDENVLRCTGDAVIVLESEATTIINNDFAFSERSVQVENSDNSTISKNTFSTHSEYCIVLGYADNNTISDNTFGHCDIQIVMEYANDNTIRNCSFSNGKYAIQMAESSRNVISGNIFNPSITLAGVKIYKGSNNSVADNSFGPSWYGLYAEVTDGIIVRDNTYPNNVVGIYVKESDHAIVEENTCLDNSKGVMLEDSWYSSVRNNTVTECSRGIELMYVQYSEIEDNNCSGNDIMGLITTESHYDTIEGNDFSGSDYGIWMTYGDSHSVVRENRLVSNGLYGILIDDADENTITNNIVRLSAGYGIYLDNSADNFIYLNIMVQNNGAGNASSAAHVQAYDETATNIWNSSEGFGNYWRDWTTPDDDRNGIVDVPYVLDGLGVDDYPLTSFVSWPSNLIATAGDAWVDLSWDAPNYTAGSLVKQYNVYRENPEGSVSVISLSGDVDTYNDTSVGTWKTYLYYVAAVNVYGEGPAGNEVDVLVPDNRDPLVTITFPDDGTYGTTYSMLVEWDGSDAGSGVSHYEIMLDGGLWLNVGNDTNYTYVSLSNGTHVVTVKVVDNASNFDTDSVAFKIGIGIVTGRIMSGGQPVAGANVSLETGEQTTTDSSGYFTLEAYAGSHILKVSKEGYDQVTRDVTLEPGQLMDLGQMEMKKSGIDLMWVIIAILVIAALATLVVVVLRARRH